MWDTFSNEMRSMEVLHLPWEQRRDGKYVMQYTGLKDKNGTEIYRGDIVNTPNGIYKVEWNQLHCSWGLFTDSGQSKNMLADWVNEDGSTPNQWENKSLEVIGNIYENPELLEPNNK